MKVDTREGPVDTRGGPAVDIGFYANGAFLYAFFWVIPQRLNSI